MRFALSLVAAAALALVTLPAKADPIAASSATYNFIHGSYTITDNGSDLIYANPGDTLTVSGDLTVNDTNDSYCPGCIIQFYVSGLGAGPDWNALSAQANVASDTYGIGTYPYTYSLTFTVPTSGTFYIGGASSLQFNYVTLNGHTSDSTNNGFVNYEIVATPEPSSLALVGTALVALGASRKRRQKKS